MGLRGGLGCSRSGDEIQLHFERDELHDSHVDGKALLDGQIASTDY
jgi:hypothetical protein